MINDIDYQITGVKDGETFVIVRRAPSSRAAYVTLLDALLNDGAQVVNVTAIHIRCNYCQEFHVKLDPQCYL